MLRENSEETGGIFLYEINPLHSWDIEEPIHGKLEKTKLHLYLAKTNATIEDVVVKPTQDAGFFSLEEIKELDTVPMLKHLLSIYEESMKNY